MKKINWGTGIVIAFALFMSFIGFLVIKMNTQDKYQHDLVTDNYYQKELEYQDKYNKALAAAKKQYEIKVFQSADGLQVTFPKGIQTDQVKGSVFMYRPSNKNLDFSKNIRLENDVMLIPSDELVAGRWDIEINWNYENTPYYYSTKLTLH